MCPKWFVVEWVVEIVMQKVRTENVEAGVEFEQIGVDGGL